MLRSAEREVPSAAGEPVTMREALGVVRPMEEFWSEAFGMLLVERVVPESCKPVPIVRVLTGDAPFPRRMPFRVVEPVPPFPTPRVPVRRLVPIDVVATTWPLALVERIALEIPENHVVPRVVSVLEAFANVCNPVQVLLSEKSVEEAVVIVPEEPSEMVVPFTVIDECVRPELSSVPESVGVTVNVPAEFEMVLPAVSPLKESVEVPIVIAPVCAVPYV